MTLNPYQTPQTPQTPPEPPQKKRRSPVRFFLSSFAPLICFLALLGLLMAMTLVTETMWWLLRKP